jgi:hypothetical protein
MIARAKTAPASPSFRGAVVRALEATSATPAGEPCALDALVSNIECLHVLHAWLDECRAACVGASGDDNMAVAASADADCVALLSALVKLPVTVKVRARCMPCPQRAAPPAIERACAGDGRAALAVRRAERLRRRGEPGCDSVRSYAGPWIMPLSIVPLISGHSSLSRERARKWHSSMGPIARVPSRQARNRQPPCFKTGADHAPRSSSPVPIRTPTGSADRLSRLSATARRRIDTSLPSGARRG